MGIRLWVLLRLSSTRNHMDKQHIIEYVDQWLTENGWRLDSRIHDFALDVRLMLEQLEENDEGRRLVGTSA